MAAKADSVRSVSASACHIGQILLIMAKFCYFKVMFFPIFSHVSIKSDCREITKEVCTNTPKTVSKTVPITSCHLKQSVACEKVVKKIPKQECENVETEVQK